MDWMRRNPHFPALLGLTILAIMFCRDALIAPFWSDGDLWSNLLPVVHFRQSILVESTLPLHTTLWYGGHYQWMNPLSSFLYLPASAIWLLFPIDWGTRILLVGHLIFSLYMGWKLGGHFVNDGLTRFATAILFTSPVFPALYPGHFEKIMAWPWILFGLDFLLAEDGKSSRNGLYAGMCLAVVALTGANYYVLYAGILFICIAWSQRSLKRIQMMILGALPGLLHLPNVLHLIGVSRDASFVLLGTNVLEWPEMLISITLGLVQPIEWEKLAVLGVPVAYLFLKFLAHYLIKILRHPRDPQITASTGLLLALLLFSLFATGMIYRNHHLFDTFRVPARAPSVTIMMRHSYPIV